MADQDFNGIALAIAEQTDFGYVNATVRDLSGALAVDDGIILGDKESGDAESGITIPNLSAFSREVPQVVSSFTQSADYFLREVVEGLAITFPLKGNGADAGAPDADLAVPDEGIASLYANAGLLGATGTGSPDWKYTPRATTIYSTVHLWVADLDFIFQDCLVDTLEFAFTPGETALVTASFKVGSVQSYNADVTFPTFTWGFQSSLAPPVVENVNFGTFGLTRGFEDLKISIANNVVEFKDSNVATTGLRQSQVDRVITVDGRMYLNETTSDAAHTSLVNTSAPTAALSLQLGTADSDGEVTALNAISMNVLNLQPKDIKYDRTGTAAVVEISGAKATGTTAGSEFMFEYN
jgi:hypothetical protein